MAGAVLDIRLIAIFIVAGVAGYRGRFVFKGAVWGEDTILASSKWINTHCAVMKHN